MLRAVHTVFDGTLFALWTDFNFILPYLVGRVLILSEKQELLWARCAVWIAAVLSLLGLFEVFIFGRGAKNHPIFSHRCRDRGRSVDLVIPRHGI